MSTYINLFSINPVNFIKIWLFANSRKNKGDTCNNNMHKLHTWQPNVKYGVLRHNCLTTPPFLYVVCELGAFLVFTDCYTLVFTNRGHYPLTLLHKFRWRIEEHPTEHMITAERSLLGSSLMYPLPTLKRLCHLYTNAELTAIFVFSCWFNHFCLFPLTIYSWKHKTWHHCAVQRQRRTLQCFSCGANTIVVASYTMSDYLKF